MNETQKALFIVGILLFLFILAQQLLFTQNMSADLATAQYNYELENLFQDTQQPETGEKPAAVYQDEILTLEQKLHNAGILKYLVLLGSAATFVASFFLRDKKRQEELEEESDDDIWQMENKSH